MLRFTFDISMLLKRKFVDKWFPNIDIICNPEGISRPWVSTHCNSSNILECCPKRRFPTNCFWTLWLTLVWYYIADLKNGIFPTKNLQRLWYTFDDRTRPFVNFKYLLNLIYNCFRIRSSISKLFKLILRV